jgi:hypothetical protein
MKWKQIMQLHGVRAERQYQRIVRCYAKIAIELNQEYKTKESTKDFILTIMILVGVAGFFFMFFFGFGYIMYQDITQDERMYTKCIDTCERVFQEQKLIECMQTCNNMNGGTNQTNG